MVPMGVPVGWDHLVRPQGAGHSVLKGPGHGACLAFSFSLSFLSFSPCFSSSPAVNKKNQGVFFKSRIATDSLGLINLAWLYNVHAECTFFLFSWPGNPWLPPCTNPEPIVVAVTPPPS